MAGTSAGATGPTGNTIAPRFVEEKDPPTYAPAVGFEEPVAQTAPAPYDMALSRAVAAWISEYSFVEEFRARLLPKDLVPWPDVANWMRQRGTRDPSEEEATWYAWLPVRPGLFWQAQYRVQSGTPGSTRLEIPDRELLVRNPQPRELVYAVPHEAIPLRQAVQTGTRVEVLWMLVDWLVKAAPWTEAQASVFVLTGLTPLIRPLRVKSKQYGRLATQPRLVLEVDPRMTQRELAAAYQHLRDQVLAPDSRHHDLSEKHLELAVFGTQREGRDGTLTERMARWNAAHPGWAYQRSDNFSRDLSRARRRLLPDLWEVAEAIQQRERPDLMAYPVDEWEYLEDKETRAAGTGEE